MYISKKKKKNSKIDFASLPAAIFYSNTHISMNRHDKKKDIDFAIAWAIFAKDSNNKDDPNHMAKRMRLGMILKIIVDNS